VLVVNDDARVRTSLGRILVDAGYRWASASTVAQARARLAGAPFDLMLCDVRLSGAASSLDLVEHMLVHHPDTIAVMMSGLDDIALADRALAMGACGYLVKPFDANDVLRNVTSAISRPA
jgi:DNA-binding NtrC family response regulator